MELDKLTVNNSNITDKNQIVNFLNECFVNISKNLSVQPNLPLPLNYIKESLKPNSALSKFELTTENEIIKIIKSLPSKMSCGWDELSPFL